MKKALFVIMALLLCLTLASAEKMAAGGCFYEGFPNVDNTAANMFGGFFSYDFNEWLGAKADLGSFNIAQHLETEQTANIPGFGVSTHNTELDTNANALPYISLRLLAFVPFTNGRVYFGPGYFTATAKGDGKYTETDTDNNYDIEIKKLAVSGISLTLGGSINVTSNFFLFGETMVIDAYQAEHEYEYTFPGATYPLTETGKGNGGFASVGIGAGFMF
jgi:hypothetical protein